MVLIGTDNISPGIKVSGYQELFKFDSVIGKLIKWDFDIKWRRSIDLGFSSHPFGWLNLLIWCLWLYRLYSLSLFNYNRLREYKFKWSKAEKPFWTLSFVRAEANLSFYQVEDLSSWIPLMRSVVTFHEPNDSLVCLIRMKEGFPLKGPDWQGQVILLYTIPRRHIV